MPASLKLVHSENELEARRWKAVERRDVDSNGEFWTCVKTTGVYCLPSCAARPLRKNVIFADTRRAAEDAGYRPCKRCRPERYVQGGLAERIERIDWERAGAVLNAEGWAPLGRMLNDEECRQLIGSYDEDERYRSTVVMRRHGFGEGEYRYFNETAPRIVAELRARFYEKLAPLANQWAGKLGRETGFPVRHAAYLKHCAKAGQARPTPLILKYGPGDYNRLHQDLYGDEVFPLQIALLLSAPGKDFTGGEFVMTEQTPRRQSRAIVAPLEQGDAIAFAVNERPAEGARGIYRVKMRHGVSEVRTGSRYCLGVIFHDAA
ncbi:2OG-Fe(II) oxygenase [Hyphococcus sp.]|uniref:2OG-Fe(II) oxygenase n=1 Tax=Hyphococcus sp. TaxID=2038636 RepID=UPI003CCBBA04